MAGATVGERCPTDFTTVGRGASSSSDCGCFDGLYETTNAGGMRICVSCPDASTQCDKTNTKLEALPLAQGFWRQSTDAIEIRPCFTPSACLGGPNVTAQCAPSQLQGSPYCAVCTSGHYGGGDGALCQPCEGSTFYTFLPVIIIGSVLLLVIALGVFRCARGEDAQRSLSRALRVSSFVIRIVDKANSFMVKLRILITLYQMLGYIGINFGVVYPPAYRAVLNALSSVLQIDLPTALPLGCFINVGFFRSLILRTLPQLIVILLLAGAARFLRAKPVAAATCSSASFFVLFLVYPSASSATFTAFICDELENGVQMLRVDYSVTCWQGEHMRIVVYAAAMLLIFPIGTPVLYAALLYASREQLERIRRAEATADAERTKLKQRPIDPHGSARESSRGSGSARESSSRWSAASLSVQSIVESEDAQRDEAQRLRSQLPPAVQQLTDGYEMRCFWFEIFQCLSKLLLLGCPIFFPMGSASQLVVGLLVCFINSMLYAGFSPYSDEDDGRLAELCQLSLFFVLVSTINLRMEGKTSADTLGLLLVVTLFIPLVVGILLHTGLHTSPVVLNAKARVAHFLARTMARCCICAERPTASSREPTGIEPDTADVSTSSNVLLPDAPALPRTDLTGRNRRSSACFSGATKERPVGDKGDAGKRHRTAGSAESTALRRASLEKKRKELEARKASLAQESDGSSSRRIVSLEGRARADSLAEDPSACWLTMRPTSPAPAPAAPTASQSGRVRSRSLMQLRSEMKELKRRWDARRTEMQASTPAPSLGPAARLPAPSTSQQDPRRWMMARGADVELENRKLRKERLRLLMRVALHPRRRSTEPVDATTEMSQLPRGGVVV